MRVMSSSFFTDLVVVTRGPSSSMAMLILEDADAFPLLDVVELLMPVGSVLL
jgi:hypothetical protein